MLTGAHVILYSTDAVADRAFLADVLGLPGVDAGDGWLIMALPPAEVAVHPTGGRAQAHELYLMCDDVDAQVAELEAAGVRTAPVTDEGWGRLTSLHLPSGAVLGLYEPRHPTPHAASDG